MTSIQRYDAWPQEWPFEAEDGDLVTYEDHRKIVEELEAENKKLHKAIEIYERERTRFKHAKPEMTGEFFIAGCHGSKDNNLMPQFIEVCPAYGAGWVMIYKNTGRTISYEGS